MGGVIYFIQAGTNGPVKIGVSRDPLERLKALQHACPEKLYLRATVPGGQLKEQEIHALLAPWRIRGEWYRPGNALMYASHVLQSEAADIVSAALDAKAAA